MASFQKFRIKIVDLIFRRVIFLFLVGTALSFVLIDQERVRVKTLNTMVPTASDLKEFVYHPHQMDKEKMKYLLIYYKYLYHIMGTNTYEKPAAAGIIGYAYYYLGDEKKAVYYLSLSNKIYGHFFWVYYDLGIIAYKEKNYVQAMADFDQAKDAYSYTVGFLLTTRCNKYIAHCLKLKQEDLEKNLYQGAQFMKKLDVLCETLLENPDIEAQFQRKEIDLRLL